MEKEIKTYQGEIQAIRKDFKALEIENSWYNAFDSSLKDFKKGDNVKIEFVENKQFKNIKSIQLIKPNITNASNPIKQNKDTLASQILSYSKDIFIELRKTDKQIRFEDITKLLAEEFKAIKNLIE
jgi:prefoldin subunit 5